MNVIFKKENFDMSEFVQLLESDGFDIYNIGGEHNNEFIEGSISETNNGQLNLVGKQLNISICSPNVFLKTLTEVEQKFGYQLFK